MKKYIEFLCQKLELPMMKIQYVSPTLTNNEIVSIQPQNLILLNEETEILEAYTSLACELRKIWQRNTDNDYYLNHNAESHIDAYAFATLVIADKLSTLPNLSAFDKDTVEKISNRAKYLYTNGLY